MKYSDIPGIPGYKISKDGDIYSEFLKDKMKMNVIGGYYKLNLRINGKPKSKNVHCLVAQTYIPNPNNYPKVNHKDCNKLNNSVENLEWTTRRGNAIHAFENGLIKQYKVPVLQISYKTVRKRINTFSSAAEASQVTGVSKNQISRCCNGDSVRGDFYWKFKTREKSRGIPIPVIQYELLLEEEVVNEFESIIEASRKLKIPPSNITGVCQGRRKTAGGYFFKYKNPIPEITEDISGWKSIPGYSQYKISPDGKIYSIKSKIIMKLGKDGNGYITIKLINDEGQRKSLHVHRLVALTYIPNEDENKIHVNHLNGEPGDNRVENLEWATRSRNAAHAFEIGLNKGREVIQYDSEGTEIQRYRTISEAVRETGISRNSIQECLAGTKEDARGMIFKLDDSSRIQSRKKSPIIQYDKEDNELKCFSNVREASLEIGCTMGSIYQNLCGRSKYVQRKYKFKYQ